MFVPAWEGVAEQRRGSGRAGRGVGEDCRWPWTGRVDGAKRVTKEGYKARRRTKRLIRLKEYGQESVMFDEDFDETLSVRTRG